MRNEVIAFFKQAKFNIKNIVVNVKTKHPSCNQKKLKLAHFWFKNNPQKSCSKFAYCRMVRNRNY